MTMHERTPQKNPLMSIGLRAATATVIGYKVSHLRAPEQLIDVIELGFFFCLSSQYQVTLFFSFFSNQKSTVVLSNPDMEPIKSLSQSMAAWAAF